MTPEFTAGFNAGIAAARKWHEEQAKMLTDAFDNSNSLAASFAYRATPFHEQASRAISALTVPSDLVAVPREPSEVMALHAIEKCHLPITLAKLHHVKEIYRAMISTTEPRK